MEIERECIKKPILKGKKANTEEKKRREKNGWAQICKGPKQEFRVYIFLTLFFPLEIHASNDL